MVTENGAPLDPALVEGVVVAEPVDAAVVVALVDVAVVPALVGLAGLPFPETVHAARPATVSSATAASGPLRTMIRL
jgi:hypothetical protein